MCRKLSQSRAQNAFMTTESTRGCHPIRAIRALLWYYTLRKLLSSEKYTFAKRFSIALKIRIIVFMNRKFCGEVRHYWCESFDRRSGRRVDAAAAVRNWMKRLRNSTLSSWLIISVQDPGGGGWTLVFDFWFWNILFGQERKYRYGISTITLMLR